MKVVPIDEANGKLEDFELFWSVFPKKRAKLDALEAWKKTAKLRPPIEELLAAVRKLSTSTSDLEFCPHPATWLRRGQWSDE